MAESEQFASDALITPKSVLAGQLEHQLPALGREASVDQDHAGSRRRPSDDGPALDASREPWPAAPGAGHRLTVCGQGQPGFRRSAVRQQGRGAVRRRPSSSAKGRSAQRHELPRSGDRPLSPLDAGASRRAGTKRLRSGTNPFNCSHEVYALWLLRLVRWCARFGSLR